MHVFIEFAAIASKYGYQQGENFQDNDEESVKKYAENWLKEAGVNNYTYLGSTRELEKKEPYRYLYKIIKA